MSENPQALVATIGELALVCPGYSPRPEERRASGKYLLVGGRNIKDGRIVTTDKDTYIEDIQKESFRRAVAQPGDIVVSTLFDTRKLCIYREADPQAVVNSSCAIIRAPGTNDYIVSYLRTLKGREQFLSDATKATFGAVIPRLSTSALSRIQVPLLPFSQLVTELQRFGDAHIESSSANELLALQAELRGKDEEIELQREQLRTLQGKDEEIQGLRTELTRLTGYYENRIQKIEAQKVVNDLASKIANGETAKLEFKSSLRWNIKANRDDPNLELAVLKTIAAFCNTEGGELLIGVADDQSILGIGNDHFPNEDKFLLHLRNLIMDKLIPSVVHCVDYELVTLAENRVCRVVCKRSSEDVWLKAERSAPEVFCVRAGPSSTELQPREACRYIREHFGK